MSIPITKVETSTWEFESGLFYCLHDGDVLTETVELDTMVNGEHDTYEQEITVCADCDEQLEVI